MPLFQLGPNLGRFRQRDVVHVLSLAVGILIFDIVKSYHIINALLLVELRLESHTVLGPIRCKLTDTISDAARPVLETQQDMSHCQRQSALS